MALPAEAANLSRGERLAAARILGRYRKLILLGRLVLPVDAARRLVGPDCAYRLYGRTKRGRPSS